MTSLARKSIVTLFAGGAIVAGVASPASAAPPLQIQDGLVNVAVGDVTILEDVNVGVAAVVGANICDVDVGPVAVLGRAVDRSGEEETVCINEQGEAVTLTQN